ncbi:hypothetical protein GALMADRAFT_251264 [Galerina marginata CBS 339.88]|uniref:Uncharacterized protein n=1 Tax=Galerina marginata (strain CBS 339.88) TaxID=685588 RepID=A0A067SU19_GALM3|nr:hypothetical protein GALMADRAFT_251264 [Galerina marginata CBS 339.88]
MSARSLQTSWQRFMDPSQQLQVSARKVQRVQLSATTWSTIAYEFSKSWHKLPVKGEPTVLLAISVSLLVLAWIFVTTKGPLKLRKRSCQMKIAFDSHALLVLSTVFTPTSVAWPLSFFSCFKSVRLASSSCIEIDLMDLMEQILQGRIELRDSSDAKYLFRGQLLIYGWSIKVYTCANWWVKTAIWIAQQHLSVKRACTRENQRESTCNSHTFIAEHSPRFYDLDLVQYLDLNAEISRIQLLTQSTSSTIVEFSCLAMPTGFLTHQFMLCAIPFVPYLAGEKHGSRKNRTSAPLLAKLPDILSLFPAGTSMIDNVVNISYQHAISLQSMEKELVDNKRVRQEYIRDVGMVGWREDRLMLVWEAGLLQCGLLNRWRITLKSKNQPCVG